MSDRDLNPGECDGCDKKVKERCGGDYCRKCHKSLTFESCVDGSWDNAQRRAAGLPARCPSCGGVECSENCPVLKKARVTP